MIEKENLDVRTITLGISLMISQQCRLQSDKLNPQNLRQNHDC